VDRGNIVTTLLSPDTKSKFFNNDGTPLAFGQVTTYAAGTTTPIATYKDSTQTTTNANPIILNFRGEADIWLIPNIAYKFALADSQGNAIPGWPIDNIVDSQLVTLFGGTDTGIANAYVLNFSANFTTLTNGIIVYFIAANTNTGPSTLNVNGLGVITILNQGGNPLGSGQIVSGSVTSVIYYNGNWLLTSALGSVQQTGSFPGTFTGFTSVVTATVQYRIYNNIAFLFFNTTPPSGTSNTTAMTMTGLPAALNPFSNRFILCCTQDNGNAEQLSALLITNAGVCTFEKYSIGTGNFSTTGYTASGSKGLASDWFVSYPLL
jgi:hypothetical protein